jgi:tRNA dimethylallyltransferase
MKKENKKKVIVILGPTATGKSDLAVLLAKIYNGEIISADSRQVYKGMDIGTGKVTKKEMGGVPHYLLDVASPKKFFTVSDYKKLANEAVEKILAKNKLPILCGGTGLYIQSIVDDLVVPEVPPDIKLRKELEKKSTDELFSELERLDTRRAKNIDKNNPVRLIRAIEIVKAIGAVPKLKFGKNDKYEFLQIGLTLDKEGLEDKIHARLIKRIKCGMIAEVKRLNKSGVSWKRLDDMGLEYRFVASYLRGEMTKDVMIERLEIAIRQYAKRQTTWFKRDKRIKWFNPGDIEEIEKTVDNNLK